MSVYKADEDLRDEDLDLDEVCEHDLDLISDTDGDRVYVCIDCGAEIYE